MAANSPLLRPQPRVSCVGKRGDRPADARVEALNLKELCPCGGRVNRRGALRAAVQGVLAGFLRVAPTSHARQCTAPPRLMPAPRAPAASRGKGKCWPSRPRWTCAHAHRGGGGQGARGAFRGHFSGLAAWHWCPRLIYMCCAPLGRRAIGQTHMFFTIQNWRSFFRFELCFSHPAS